MSDKPSNQLDMILWNIQQMAVKTQDAKNSLINSVQTSVSPLFFNKEDETIIQPFLPISPDRLENLCSWQRVVRANVIELFNGLMMGEDVHALQVVDQIQAQRYREENE